MVDEEAFAYLVMESESTGDCIHFNEVGVYQDLIKAVDALRNRPYDGSSVEKTGPQHVKITVYFADGHSEPVREDMYSRKYTRDEALKKLERCGIRPPYSDEETEGFTEIYGVFLTPEEIQKNMESSNSHVSPVKA